MRIISLILTILLTAVNIFRYYLPVSLNDISVFDILSLIALMLACIIALLPKKSALTEGIILYNILGCLDSLSDELFFDPTARSKYDIIINIGLFLLCMAYIWVRVYLHKKPLLKEPTPPQNEWKTKPKNLGT